MTSSRRSINPDQLFQHGLALHQRGQLDEAARVYSELLTLYPRQPEVLSIYGTLCLQAGRTEQGIDLLKRSLAINPNQPQALFNLGIEFYKQQRLQDALASYDRALLFAPHDPEIHLNRGNTLRDLGRDEDAIASYDRAAALQPTLASAHWNKALLCLQTGQYEIGWQLYEWGWRAGERGPVRQFKQPQWLGKESIDGKTVLIHAEQGLGDTIQFCRYAMKVLSLGAHVILEVPASLVSLLSNIDSRLTVVKKGDPLPTFDYFCPMMSLPLAFGTSIDTIPADIPYLSVDRDKLDEWRRKLGPKTRPRVGLVWSGSMKNKIDLNPRSRRNVPLSLLEPLLELPFEFHALQTEFRPEDRELLGRFPNLIIHADALRDFTDTAALIEDMEVVISVCTSVAHLSGALGRKTWVLLPYAADYRWMMSRDDSPWYPTVTLFRQKSPGDWSEVVGSVVECLHQLT